VRKLSDFSIDEHIKKHDGSEKTDISKMPSGYFTTIKQEEGHFNCMACVAAMIAGCSIDKVHEWLHSEVGYPMSDMEFIGFLLNYGWVVSHGLKFETPCIIDHKTHITATPFEFTVGSLAALIGVNSRNYEGAKHAILWDGYCLRDPDPKTPDTQEGYRLAEYEVDSIYPVYRFNDCLVTEYTPKEMLK